MGWESVGESSNCITLVHDEGYLLHGTMLDEAGGSSEVIVEITDASTGTMVEQERLLIEDPADLSATIAEFKDEYP